VILSVDIGSALPPFEQIRTQITVMAASGVLPPGTRLPTIRQLAADLGLEALLALQEVTATSRPAS
jgi:GntR family transcriptional regulator